MKRPDRGTLRSAGFTVLLTVVFLTVNTSVAHAADSSGESGSFLDPLNVNSSEGAPINGYELSASGGSVFSLKSQILAFVLSGLFQVLRILVGLACWAIEVAFRFPLLKLLADPAQQVSDAYEHAVVDQLGLKGLLLGWAFIFGLVLMVRGKVGKGLGEIVLTLLIAAFAASAFIRPDYLLSEQGPLVTSQQAAGEIAQETVNSYDWGGKIYSAGPCPGMAGRDETKCLEEQGKKPVSAEQVARPIQDSVTNALVVKPYMLLQYGRILDPGKASDKKAYEAHLKWITGGYQGDKGDEKKDDPCERIVGAAGDYCRSDGEEDQCRYLSDHAERYCRDEGGPAALPGLTKGDALLDTLEPVLSEEDQQFAAFLADLKDAGPVGKECAEYAKAPSWERVGGVLLLLIAALLICAMLLSAAIVLLGTQAADAAAAAGGVVALVWGMLPGPNRQTVWKWLALFCISMMSMFGICLFLPFFGMALDVILTDGPDLMVERLLLLDVLALVGLVFHRRLLAGITTFGQRMAMRMRYAKVGGTHLPGDTSELGAALAMHGIGAGGMSAGLFGARGLSGAHQAFGARHGLLGSLAALGDGTGSVLDPNRMAGEAMAEARRGLAPLALGAHGGPLALKGAYGALIGKAPPKEDESLKLLRIIANRGENADAPGTGGAGGGVRVNPTTGEILHDPDTDRPLLGSRIHQKASRLRGYRIASTAARVGYGATLGLPRNLQAGGHRTSQYTQDAKTQLKVAANQVRQDAGQWAQAGRSVGQAVDHASQRAATAWQVHDPATRARIAARDASAGAVIYTSTPTADRPNAGGGGDRAAARQEDPAVDARRRVFDALMRAQRTSWDEEPRWGGDGE
ncbi:hypothetical protein [Streptomyces sp. NBC_00306]|uniref:hypothetical protein n=1 Tax=Streptomyces sp. NBC_00306 TaxID=2975708 RepID=UPI002E2C7B1C|nr:hypothetical protein [Streptomyces sp. NBC_00306]